ncbi:glycosyltransferase family 2 protein [Paracoccaceae bacterium GXU_MW_L88]
MPIGVVVVAYNTGEMILDCLESLLASEGADVRIVVVNNACRDDTPQIIRDWATGARVWTQPDRLPFTPRDAAPVPLKEIARPEGRVDSGEIVMINSPKNLGFAGGVNLGLKLLHAMPEINDFWILNPDSMAETQTAAAYEAASRDANGHYSFMGGRVYYTQPPQMIQSDGGRVNLWLGNCYPHRLAQRGRDVPAPTLDEIDYFAGSNIVASRQMIDTHGYMPEDYFLFFEEIDWCLSRGDLPLIRVEDGIVHHHGGATIGSAIVGKGPSELAAYFMAKSRLRFVRRKNPLGYPTALAYTLGKALKYYRLGQKKAANAAFRGALGLKMPEGARRVIEG